MAKFRILKREGAEYVELGEEVSISPSKALRKFLDTPDIRRIYPRGDYLLMKRSCDFIVHKMQGGKVQASTTCADWTPLIKWQWS